MNNSLRSRAAQDIKTGNKVFANGYSPGVRGTRYSHFLQLHAMVLLMVLAACGCATTRKTEISATAEPLIKIEVDDLVGSLGEPRTIHVPHDPVYRRSKTYLGYSVEQTFRSFLNAFPDTNLLVVFRCQDGYSPQMHLGASTPFPSLAIKDEAAAPGEDWVPLQDGSSPGPFYLVWESASPESVPWPYQLETILVYDYDTYVKHLSGNASRAASGFSIFQKTCVPCHSINHVGGKVGPDLATPFRVTSYWKRKFLKKFIQDPSSIRANSKMPKPQISEEEVEDVIRFLEKV